VNETLVLYVIAAAFIVIVPVVLFNVTPVDFDVAWVTVPPAPVAYPTPPEAEVDKIELDPVTASEKVNAAPAPTASNVTAPVEPTVAER
jgi:hypothetical protein